MWRMNIIRFNFALLRHEKTSDDITYDVGMALWRSYVKMSNCRMNSLRPMVSLRRNIHSFVYSIMEVMLGMIQCWIRWFNYLPFVMPTYVEILVPAAIWTCDEMFHDPTSIWTTALDFATGRTVYPAIDRVRVGQISLVVYCIALVQHWSSAPALSYWFPLHHYWWVSLRSNGK